LASKPGETIADYAAGAAIFARLFHAAVVGPRGHVTRACPPHYQVFQQIVGRYCRQLGIRRPGSSRNVALNLSAIARSTAAKYPGKTRSMFSGFPEDHDLHDKLWGPVDMDRLLQPHGLFFFFFKCRRSRGPVGFLPHLDPRAAKGSAGQMSTRHAGNRIGGRRTVRRRK